MKTKTIRQQFTFKASPKEVYEALMDPRQHAAFTGGSAEIGQAEGDKFSIFDGYITGTNIKIEPYSRIVQAWRAQEDGWPADHFSRLTLALEGISGGTRLTLRQSGTPEEHYEAIKQGWVDYYWMPLKRMLEGA
ncbi:MAG: SRPBCC domain-containing protein [Chloroflexota bacterium]